MKIRLIRHATLLLSLGTKKILIDPMLSSAGTMTAVDNAPNPKQNPLVELPIPLPQLLTADAACITHLHRDHFDEAAKTLLQKNLPLFCQPDDETTLRDLCFTTVYPVITPLVWEEITIHRTGGRHGTGIIGDKMGPVSGFVFKQQDESLYITGDTIWCQETINALDCHQPKIVVTNTGAAQFLTGDPIVMDGKDIIALCRYMPETKVIAVHMEAFNHCLLSRAELRAMAKEQQIDNLFIPEDGEEICFASL
ncbi:L-ascorbate metabolism protein UlaG (beta-lactamase superfamily) [Anaerospora hongkongensis]|uniref:L-ascorbate metabolism protein UlaG (Beta-lactamase superfamily) n=1 Tax=Anaerospora hongkongensis TaxID=244830 RepID=A0A4R1PZ71_9FIRM|nr:MBL fold metallo-hydrolase [Anaerospora hongkongensis]TCL38264.1 L-ascorbate metabolism protein UlaG (beta-lactamase superfamily) [Anaerospora hongkongensis]